MPDVPKPLVQKLAAGQAVLFLGPLIPGLIEEGGFPGPAELARALAEHCGYTDPDRSLDLVAQYCADTLGPADLVAFLKAQLDDPAYEPTPLHRRVARLPVPVLITASYDTLLERALREARRPFVVIASDQDLPYADESKTLLVKMLGSIERGETLVITRDQYLNFTRQLPSFAAFLMTYFATRTLLFLCYDLNDLVFNQLYATVTANLGEHVRTAYAILPAPTSYQVQHWRRKGLQIVPADPLEFLEELTTAMAQEPPPPPRRGPGGGPLTKRPFKFLDYYDTTDADIFFGRERETRDLAQLALSHRLVILTGASGTGKTSLVRAGVLPALTRQGCLAVATRVGDDPAAAVVEALRRTVPGLQLPADAPIAQAAQAAEVQSKSLIVVFLDQFEEFFVRLGPATQERFIAALAECLDDATLGTRFVLSLRSDFFVQLQAFKPHVPGVFHNTYEIQRLTPQQAQESIAAPLRAAGLDVEPGLADAIVADLDLGGVDPPQLQIVCDRLYQDALDAGRQSLTIARYRDLGGAERILDEYLDDVLARLPDADRALSRDVLKALVTSLDTKDRLSLADLVRTLAAPETDVARVADGLVADRLLRRTDEAGAPGYELVHDYLARRVREWLDEGERALKEVQEMLRRQVDGWRQHHLSLGQAEMRLVTACTQRDRLRPSDDELALVAYSAALHDLSAEAWLGRLADPTAVLLLLLDDEDPVARQRAAVRLGERGGAGVGEALAKAALDDSEPAVRAAAAEALGTLNDAAGLTRLAEAARVRETRRPAMAALAHARDVGAKLPDLRGAVRLRVLGQLAGMRVWRARRHILYEAAGGALGGAVGLGAGFATLVLFESASRTQLISRLPLALLLGVLFGFLGLGAGGLLGLLAALGAALSPRRAWVLHLVGAALGGGLGYGLVFLVFGLGFLYQSWMGFQGVVQAACAGLLLGSVVGAGAALPTLAERGTGTPRRGLIRPGLSVLGGALGGGLMGLAVNLAGLFPLVIAEPGVAAAVGAIAGGGVGLGLALAGVLLRRREGRARPATGDL